MHVGKIVPVMRLIIPAGREVYLILDNLLVHYARVVREWLTEHEDEIEIFFYHHIYSN